MSGPIAALARRVLDERALHRLRGLGRLRFAAKLVLGVERAEIEGYLREVAADPELHERLARRTGLRLDRKRAPGLGHRVAWYAAVRALRPRLVVETGARLGLGSLVLLRALAANEREGAPGRLVSFDPDPTAGDLVPDALRGAWTLHPETSRKGLERALAGERVDCFIHDTPPDHALEAFELDVIARHAAARCLLISANGHNTPALPELCARLGCGSELLTERTDHPFYAGNGLGLALLEASGDG